MTTDNPDALTIDREDTPESRAHHDRGASRIDEEIGYRIRRRRLARGMSLRELGEKLGIRPQQVHKYETAENKVSVQLLLQVATALQVPAEHLLEGLQHYPGGGALHSIRAMTREIRKVEEVEEKLLAEQKLAKDGFDHWTHLARALVQNCRADSRLETEILTNYGQLADRLQALSDLSGALAETMRRGRGQLMSALQALRAPRDDLDLD